jgi:hypothetical protein
MKTRASPANRRAFCRGVIGRSSSQVAEGKIVAVAASLLAALGDTSRTRVLAQPRHRHRHAILWPLAPLGRALTPNRGDYVTQPHLEEVQARPLQRILTSTLADGAPINMIAMPQDAPDEREIKETRRLLDRSRESAGLGLFPAVRLALPWVVDAGGQVSGSAYVRVPGWRRSVMPTVGARRRLGNDPRRCGPVGHLRAVGPVLRGPAASKPGRRSIPALTWPPWMTMPG